MADEEKVKIFISSGCGPCGEIKKFIEEGRFNLPEVDMIDVSTEEGFHWVQKMNLTKLPSAYKGDQACKLLIDEDTLIIDCSGEVEVTPG